VTFADGVLRVEPRANRAVLPIDALLRSLAADLAAAPISVILSGTASDGTLGSKAVKAEGGITFAQDETAKFDGMPRSAIAAGAIDFVLPPSEIAAEIVRITRHPYVARDTDADHFKRTRSRENLHAAPDRARRRLHTLQAADDRAAHPPAHGAAQSRDARRLH